MKQVTSTFAAAIVSPERVMKHEVLVDWDNDNITTDIDDMSHKLETVTVSQSLESQLPAQIRVVPGAAVAELDMTIARGNTFRYLVNSTYQTISSASSGSTTSNSITLPLPAGLLPGDVVLVVLFTSASNANNLLVGTNTQWAPIGLRSNVSDLTIQMQAYTRRVPVGGETIPNYVFTLSSSQVWMAIAVRVGDPYLMGITDVSTKGQDNLPIQYSVVTQTPITVDVPNSTVVSFYGANVPVSGTSTWTPLGGDTEVFDSSTTRTGTSSNISAAVNVASNVQQGVYLKQASISPSGTASAVSGIAVVLAPKLVGDEYQHAAWTFSELNPNSPYAGKTRVRRTTVWRVGVYGEAGLEKVQIFTGLSLTVGASSRNRSATLVAYDNREYMRNQWFINNWVAESPVSLNDDTSVPTLPGLETTAIISYLLAYSQYRRIGGSLIVTQPRDMGPYTGYGFFASPPIRPDSFMLWAPLHGTMFPYEGTMMAAYTRLPGGQVRRVKFAVGPYVAGTERAPSGEMGLIYGKWLCRTEFAFLWDATTQMKGRLEFWARVGATASTGTVVFDASDNVVTPTKLLRATLSAGGSFVADIKMVGGINRTITGPVVPTDGAWHFYGLHIDSVLGTVDFRVDGVTTNAVTTPWANSSTPNTSVYSTLVASQGAQVAELFIHGGLNSTFTPTNPNIVTRDTLWIIENFVPSAYIDKTVNEIDAVPPNIDNSDDFWDVISSIASAEFSALYFDGDGVVHYRNTRSDVTTAGQAIQRVLTARSTIKDLQYENGVRQIANVVSVGYTPMAQFFDAPVFSPGGALRVPANSTISIRFPLPGVIMNGLLGFALLTQNANTAPDGSGIVVANADTAVFLLIENFTGQLNIENINPYDIYMVDTSGQSTVDIVGTFVGPTSDSVSPVMEKNMPSIRKYDVQPLEIGTSPWIQDEDVARMFALFLISELGEPRPVIKNIPIKGDPRLQLGDQHAIQDVNGLGVNGGYRLTGINHSADAGGTYRQDLTVRQASTVARWNANYWNDGTVWGV